MTGELDVVGRRARALAELAEVEPGEVVGLAPRPDPAAVDLEARIAVHVAVGDALELGGQAPIRVRLARPQEESRALEQAQAVVGAAVQFLHAAVLFDQCDRRQEALALQAAAVQLLRRQVGGRDQRHALVEQRLEQGAEDHRVGDVADRELV